MIDFECISYEGSVRFVLDFGQLQVKLEKQELENYLRVEMVKHVMGTADRNSARGLHERFFSKPLPVRVVPGHLHC